MLNRKDILGAISGTLESEGPETYLATSTDSREDCTEKLFFPLKGENFDGHDYIEKAVEMGASGFVCDDTYKIPRSFKSHLGIFRVNDSLKAYQDLAHWVRHAYSPKTVAITGSNGKSSTKEFATTLISEKYHCLSPIGSYNNHVGVPKTLLDLNDTTDVAVIEMGMNHPNEIKRLVEIADPDVVVVTTVGRAHLEGLGGIEQVAEAKEEIYRFSRDDTVRIFNLDNEWTRKMYNRYRKSSKTMTFSSHDPKADVCFTEVLAGFDYIEFTGRIMGEPGKVKVPIFGRQNLGNLMAATCLALSVGVEADLIWKALPKCKSLWGRNQVVSLRDGIKILFDAYNANPDSMQVLLSNVSRMRLGGQKHVVIGEMLELGEDSDLLHEELGRQVGEMDFASVVFIGSRGEAFQRGLEQSQYSKKSIISDTYKESLASEFRSVLQPHDVVLVKGSRGMRLEDLIVDLDPTDFAPKS